MIQRSRLFVEQLEDRTVPAAFGIPWASPQITISFVPDGTDLPDGTDSNLLTSLDRDRSRESWQKEILTAFQTWAEASNINVSVVPDSGAPLGTPGRWQGDDRFGDIRIAGTRMATNILALGTPPDPSVAGTSSGDIIVNTNHRFNSRSFDLRTVLLQEAGHALGLENSPKRESVMYTQYEGKKSRLDATDVVAIQTLYGTRQLDSDQGQVGQNIPAMATSIRGAGAGSNATTLLSFGELSSKYDLDVFSFVTPNRPGTDQNITVKLQTAGLSLLSARLSVVYLDRDGKLQEAANTTMNPDDFRGGSTSVTFDANDDSGPRTYYVLIQSSDKATFAVGSYALAVSFDGKALERTDLTTLLDGPNQILVNADGNTNNTLGTATRLTANTSIQGGGRAEVLASLESSTDIDYYRLTGSATANVLTVSVRSLNSQATPMIEILNSSGTRLATSVLVNASGVWTIQAIGLKPGEDVYVRTSGSAGNYHLTADLRNLATPLQEFAKGTLSDAKPARVDTLFVTQPQFFHLSLAVPPGSPVGTVVRMTIRDMAGNVAVSLSAGGAQTVTGQVLLGMGEYDVQFEVVSPTGIPLQFAVSGTALSDPIGMPISNPTNDPSNPLPPGGGWGYLGFTAFCWLPSLF